MDCAFGGAAQTGEKAMLAQSRAIASAAGMPIAQVEQSLAFDRKATSWCVERKIQRS